MSPEYRYQLRIDAENPTDAAAVADFINRIRGVSVLPYPEQNFVPTEKTFRQLLRESRIAARLTGRELAQIVGISYTHYNKVETGKRHPPKRRV